MADAPSAKKGVTRRVDVLTLSQESAHVRSLARSWAAGEVGVDDYRMIRSLTIEGMLSGEFVSTAPNASADDDDNDITAVGHDTVAEGDDTHPRFQAISEDPPMPPASPLPRIALVAGALLLVLGLIILFGRS